MHKHIVRHIRWFTTPSIQQERLLLIVLSIAGAVFTLIFQFNNDIEKKWMHSVLPISFSLVGFILTIKALLSKGKPLHTWIMLMLNHLWVVAGISFNEHFTFQEVLFYLSGIVVSGAIGYVILYRIQKKVFLKLDDYNGIAKLYPRQSMMLFFLAALALGGFPITTTFIGEDLLMSHIHPEQIGLILVVSLDYVIAGIALVYLYSKVFLGPLKGHGHTYSKRLA